jgi:hypothetical protein
VRIAALRLALHDERLATDGELITRTRACDRARPYLERCCLGVDAGVAEADDCVRTPRDDPYRDRLTAGRRVEDIDREHSERRVNREASFMLCLRPSRSFRFALTRWELLQIGPSDTPHCPPPKFFSGGAHA